MKKAFNGKLEEVLKEIGVYEDMTIGDFELSEKIAKAFMLHAAEIAENTAVGNIGADAVMGKLLAIQSIRKEANGGDEQ